MQQKQSPSLIFREIARLIFPGFGFFGANDDFSLKLSLNSCIDRIVISLDSKSPEFLNIGKIRFFGINNTEIPRAELCLAARLSTIYGNKTPEDVNKAFFNGSLLHSLKEINPSLTIIFSQPREISRMEIYNRGDINGRRSKHLTVTTFSDENVVLSWQNMNLTQCDNDLRTLLAKLNIPETDIDDCNSPKKVAQFVINVRSRIKKEILEGNFELDIYHLIQLLPMYKIVSRVNDFHLTICAAILVALRGKRYHVDTRRLFVLRFILTTDLDIVRLCKVASKIIAKRTGQPINLFATKHRFQPPELVSNKDKYLVALDRLFSLLQSWGITPILCYGTILGAIRIGEFIPYDDDVDILYFDGSTTREESCQKRDELINKFRNNGFKILDKIITANFHVVIDCKTFDIFPCWQKGSNITLMMEYYKYRSIPANILLPTSKIKLYDRMYPGPANPQEFLRERYGNNWMIADPYYEWPWPITKILKTQALANLSSG